MKNLLDLTGKKALVTGGSRGIGHRLAMADCMGDDEAVFGSKLLRKEVCEIDFVKMNLASIPSGAWDVSEDQDKTIWAWK